MKKTWRIISIVLIAMLVVAGLSVAVFAANGNEARAAGTAGFTYTDASGNQQTTTDFAVALTNAKAGTKVQMTGDTTYQATGEPFARVSQTLTVDLGGYSLEILQNGQSGIYVSGNSTVLTFENGKLMTTRNDSYVNRSYALFINASGTPKLVLNNVSTATGSLAITWTNLFNVEINGGQHSVTHAGQGVYGGFVESRTAMNFVANDATFFVDSSNWLVTHVVTNDSFAATKSSFTFNGCKIIEDPTDPTDAGLIKHANDNAVFKFIGCDIAGAIKQPTIRSNDKVTTPVDANNIIIGSGTRFTAASIFAYQLDEGCKAESVSATDSYNILDYNDNPTTNGFTSTERNISASFDSSVKLLSEFAFEYVQSSELKYTNDLSVALTGADAGSTVTMLKNTTYTAPTNNDTYIHDFLVVATLGKNLEIDLGGKTLTILQPEQNPIVVNKALTVRNGTIRAARSNYNNQTYPVFQLGTAGAVLNLENVNTYAGCIAYSNGVNGATVNVSGGEHYITNTAQGAIGASWITSVGSITINVSDAFIYTYGNRAIISSNARKQAADIANTNIVFTGCTLIAYSNYSIIKHANEKTFIWFNDCDISAPINPALLYDSESVKDTVGSTTTMWGQIKAGSIVLGEGTRYDATKTMIGGGVITVAQGYEEIDSSYSNVLTIEHTTEKPYDDSFSTISTKLTVKYTKAVEDPADLVFLYVKGGAELYCSDLITAIENADANTVIRMRQDHAFVGSGDPMVKVSRALTLDLGGCTLKMTQNGQSGLLLNANFTIQNGTIYTARSDSNNTTYPFLRTNAAGITVNLINLTTHTGGFIYNQASTTINVVGGSHHAVLAVQGTVGKGWIVSSAPVNFTATDAFFYCDSSIGIVASNSRKQAANIGDSIFLFERCTLIADPDDSAQGYNLIRNGNENTFITFNECDISGAINPTVYNDSESFRDTVGSTTTMWGAMQPGSIVFGIGTRYVSTYTMIGGGVIKAVDGYAIADESASASYTVVNMSDTPITDAQQFTTTTVNYNVSYGRIVGYPGSYNFSYVTGGITVYGNDIVTALTKSDASTTVYFLDDFTFQTVLEPICYISKDITVDLDGHVFTVYQEWQNSFYIQANVKFKNGEIRTVRSSDIKKEYDAGGGKIGDNAIFNNKSYPLFYLAADGKTLTLENITSYSGSLILSVRKNTTVNIIGGVHYATNHDTAGAQGAWGGLIEMRNSATVNVTGATLVADRSSWIVTAASYYEDATNPVGAVFTFKDCKIISDPDDNDGTFELFKHANENTRLVFNNCLIYGSINPTVNANDKKGGANGSSLWGGISTNNIVFGEGTRVASCDGQGHKFTILGYATEKSDLSLIDEAYSEVIVLNMCNDRPYTDGYIFTKVALKCAFDRVVASNLSITITYHYPDGTVSIENYPIGSLITSFPTYENPGSFDNGWVRIEFDGGWALGSYGERLDSLVASGRLHLYPSATSAKAYISTGLYNLTLYGNVGANLFLQDMDSRPDGIVIEGIYDIHGNEIAIIRRGIEAKGNTYDMYEIGRVGVLEIDTPLVAKVHFSYYGVEFTQTITLKADKYVERTLLDKNTNSRARTLIADMVRYANALYQYQNKDSDAVCPIYEREITLADGTTTTLNLTAALYTSKLGTADNFTAGGSLAANEYIESISFNVGGTEPSYVIYFKSGARVVDVRIEMKGAWLSDKVGSEIGNVSYGIDRSKSTYESGAEFLSMAHTTGISVYNFLEDVEIVLTVLDYNGGQHTVRCGGAYSLADYYNGIKAGGSFTEADIARAKNILNALYSFSSSTSIYRFGTTLHADDVGEVANNNVLNVYYEDFGAKADGVTDDFAAIQAAHAYANEMKAAGKFVTVYAIKPGGSIKAGATFFIDNTDPSSPTHATSAVIKTDVDFTGAKFVINDYAIFEGTDSNNPSYTKVEKASNAAHYTPIFKVLPDNVLNSTTSYYVDMAYSGKLLSTDTHIKGIADLNLPFEYALVSVRNNNHGHYVRYGANASITVQNEVILVNTRTGEIDPSTPIVHDFLQVSFLRIYDASAEAITIEGGEFETLYNRVNSYSYNKRGIEVLRSNTTVKGITHDYTYSAFNDKVSGGAPMHLFIGTEYTHGVSIDGCTLEGPRRFWDTDNGNGTGSINRGSYSIRADYTTSLSIKNITQTNLYTDNFTTAYDKTGDGMADHNAIMGSNFCKNMLFEGNRMSTFDSHMDLYNLTFRNNEVERINVVGAGTVYIEDSLIHSGNTGAIVTLREDYNSNFKGDVYFKNVTVETYNNGYVALFLMTYYNYNTGLYYTDGQQYTVNSQTVTDSYYTQDKTKGDGDDSHYYTSYLPQNVYVEGLTVLSGGRVTTDSTKELGGTYTRGTENTSVTLSLYSEYSNKGENKTQKYIHNWNCDISTYGSSFTEGRYAIGNWVITEGTTYTVNNPIKPTENVFIDATTYSKYTMHDYTFKGKAYDSLKFLDNLKISKI